MESADRERDDLVGCATHPCASVHNRAAAIGIRESVFILFPQVFLFDTVQ
jgi:hypothetical protein